MSGIETKIDSYKQSSVEWLEKEINKRGPMENNPPQWLKDLYKQAKAMHKEEMIDSFGVGCQVEASRLIGYHEMAEQYYNETFNTEEK